MTTATSLLEQVAERGRTPLLVAVGAGDLAVEQARTVLATLRSRAEAIPGEAQVQVDLATREARTRAEQAADRARGLVTVVRPEAVVNTVAGLVEQARTQAAGTVEALAERGADVLQELRRQPGFRRFAVKAEQVVDTVEDAVEEVIEEAAEAVTEASDEVTSLVQKAASRTTKAAARAEAAVDQAADQAKAVIEETAEAADEATAKAARKPAKRTTAARGKAATATSARVTRTRTATTTD
jgi:heparin binding hemagglutinin HbhA